MAEEAQVVDGEGAEGAEGQPPAATPETPPPDPKAKEPTKAKEPAPAEGDKPPPDKGWRDFITDPEARKQADRFEDLDSFFKANADLRKDLSTRIKVPGEGASEEDIAKFRKAIGVPDKPEDYKISLPEGVEMDEVEQEFFEALKPAAQEANVPAGAFEQFAAKFKEFEQQVLAAAEAENQKFVEEAEAELRKAWGKDYEANRNIGNRAMNDMAEKLGRPELIEFIRHTKLSDGRFIGDHPEMARLFAHLGRRMSEDGVIEPVSADDAKSIQSKMQELTAAAHQAQSKGDRATAERLFNERRALAERLEGETPIVGQAGRSA